jgi:hypothetical protein
VNKRPDIIRLLLGTPHVFPGWVDEQDMCRETVLIDAVNEDPYKCVEKLMAVRMHTANAAGESCIRPRTFARLVYCCKPGLRTRRRMQGRVL